MKPWHFFALIVVIIIIFGAAKLPDIARSLGQSAKVLKKEMGIIPSEYREKNK